MFRINQKSFLSADKKFSVKEILIVKKFELLAISVSLHLESRWRSARTKTVMTLTK